MKLDYSNFEIGQVVVCVRQNTDDYIGGDADDERIILGEKYTIIDLDFHFPDRLCVKLKGPYYFHNEFVPIKCFVDVAFMRDKKLTDLGI